MLNNNNKYNTFNDFSQVPEIPYNIAEYLIENGQEEFWKLLKYQTKDACDKANLTFEEKVKMVWDGVDPEQQNYTIFFKPLISTSMTTAEQQMRMNIYRILTKPVSANEAILVYEIDVICSEACGEVYKNRLLVERTDYIESLLLSSLNGSDIGGSQYAMFNRELDNTCGSSISINNGQSYYGRSMYIAIRLTKPTKGSDCGC